MKPRPPIVIFLLFALAYVLSVWLTREQLPDPVASHFDARDQPNVWTSRDEFIHTEILFGLSVPVVVIAAFWCCRLMAWSWMYIPNRRHWLAPERRSETYSRITTAGFWLAIGALVFLSALHHLTVAANTQPSPQFDSRSMLVWLAATALFGIGVVVRLLVGFARIEPPG